MPRVARGTHRTYIRVKSALRSIAAEKQSFHFPLNFQGRSIQCFAAGIDDDGPLGVQPIEVQAHGFAYAPLDAIADHGFAEGAGGSEPDMRSVRLRFANAEGREQGTGETGSVFVDASEVVRTKQAYTFGKTGDGILPLGTNGEFLAAPGSATRQHRTAILGFHTG